jgi:M6 family metalloprotease-like protein
VSHAKRHSGITRRNVLALGVSAWLPVTAGSPARAATPDRIPVLDRKGNPYLSEGPTDSTRNLQAVGSIKAQMVFVDFADAPGDPQSTEGVADHLTGSGKAEKWFRDQSYGRLSFEITRISGWRRMPKPSTSYTGADKRFTFQQHKAYIADAAALFPELDLRTHPLLFIVGAKTDAIAVSPTFIAPPADAPVTPTGPIRWCVTFGKDSYTNNHINLCHEVCHTFGLPDLYNFTPFGFTTGAWDIMCDIFRGTSLIGWHRHKLGWLADTRKVYLARGQLETVLTPLPGSTGASMIVVPADSPLNPSKVYAIELAQPIQGRDGTTTTGDGVLVYSVDASVPTGKSPVRIVPAKTTTSPVYGDLFEAPFSSGSILDEPTLPFSLSIKAKRPDGYVVALNVR